MPLVVYKAIHTEQWYVLLTTFKLLCGFLSTEGVKNSNFVMYNWFLLLMVIRKDWCPLRLRIHNAEWWHSRTQRLPLAVISSCQQPTNMLHSTLPLILLWYVEKNNQKSGQSIHIGVYYIYHPIRNVAPWEIKGKFVRICNSAWTLLNLVVVFLSTRECDLQILTALFFRDRSDEADILKQIFSSRFREA